MSRAIHLAMSEAEVVQQCHKSDVGVSAIETLVSGGVRLVTTSGEGAETIRRKLKSKLITGDVKRTPTFIANRRW